MSPPRYSDIQALARNAATMGGARAARAVADIAQGFMGEIAAQSPTLAEKLDHLACGRACTSCCHQMVGVTAAEIDWLADAVGALPTARRKAVITRIRDIAARSAGLDVAGWWAARLPCPLLDGDGACAVHHARPLPCRAMNSADAEICRRAFAGQADARSIPVLAAQHGIFGHAQAGLAQATRSAPVPLAAGLAQRFQAGSK